ncbi:MAG: ATP-binding cassette domain-containing protein [Acidaminococcales bacterium]|nr:ATP-binding cassette domain-containing protein [Acidaminococcales bacterium]
MAILELMNVTKKYGSDVILSDASFALAPGTSLAITGESGGGKTTLLSLAGLLQDASSGRIMLDGRETAQATKAEKAKLRGNYYGFIFQRARLVNSLNALENVLAPVRFIRRGKDSGQKARALLAALGLEGKMHCRPQELSLGQLRRVALARALLTNPPILLADEPTNDLDQENARIVSEQLFLACAGGSAAIIVTHDCRLAESCDRWLHLKQGALQEKKRPL